MVRAESGGGEEAEWDASEEDKGVGLGNALGPIGDLPKLSLDALFPVSIVPRRKAQHTLEHGFALLLQGLRNSFL